MIRAGLGVREAFFGKGNGIRFAIAFGMYAVPLRTCSHSSPTSQ